MLDFGMILGMDSYPLTMWSWIVTLRSLPYPYLVYHWWCVGFCSRISIRVISFIQAQRLVARGCLAYLHYVWDISKEFPSIDSIMVVCEFIDVFPVDLSSLHPYRDIDFVIDLE